LKDELHLRITIDLSRLKAYHGYQSSIIPLTSGYYFYLANWDRTPTAFSHFSNIWLVTPEDKRILFSDPPSTSGNVCIYHEIHGASIGLNRTSENRFDVRCKSLDDAYELNIEFQLNEPLTSRLLVAIGSGPPARFRTSKPVISASNFLVNLLVTKGGSTLVGRTETGQPFYHGETERLFQVIGGSISLNGEDIGNFMSPTWSIEFGDAVPYIKPVVKPGTLYIPFDREMVKDSH
jgi:hypothetical protein